MERKNPHKDEGFFHFSTLLSFQVKFILTYILLISNTLFLLGQESNPIAILNQQLSEARDSKDFRKLADLYLEIGVYEQTKSKNYSKAFEYYTRSLDYNKLLADSLNYYKIKHKIANQYRLTEQRKEAISIFQEIIDYYRRNNLTKELSNAYLDLAITYGDDNFIDEQGRYLNKAKEYNELKFDSLFYINYLFEKIRYHKSMYENDDIYDLSIQAYKMAQSFPKTNFQSKALYSLAELSVEEKEIEESIRYANNAILLLNQSPLNTIKLDIYKLLAESYRKVGDSEKAFSFISKYSILNDSILNKDRVEAINNVTFKYEAREKNNEIKLLEKEKELVSKENISQRRIVYVLGLGMLLLSVAIYFIVQYFRQRIKGARIINLQREELNNQKIKELENEVKISSLQSVLEGQELERERIAKDLHDSLGGLLSAVKLQFEKAKSKGSSYEQNREYQYAQNLLDTSVEEVRNISRNLQPGSLKQLGLVAAINDLINRYVGDAYPEIHFQHYDLPKDLNTMIATSIYRIIQELLNNAIKHAKADEIIIQLNKEDDEILISFEDDGIGFDPKEMKSLGMGLENIQSRVNYLKGNLEIDSTRDDGTSFLINVKYTNV